MLTTQQPTLQPVPQTVLNNWKNNLQQADKVAIAILYGYSLTEVITAFDGHATTALVLDINHYCGLTK